MSARSYKCIVTSPDGLITAGARYRVTNGPRNHLLTLRKPGMQTELHYPLSLFDRQLAEGNIVDWINFK